MEEISVVSPMKKMKILGEKQQNFNESGGEEIKSIKSLDFLVTKPQQQEEQSATDAAKEQEHVEPLLVESTNQYVIFPIQHESMWHMYKEFVDNFWSPTESIQNIDAYGLNYDETDFLKSFSLIYASPQSRGLVNENFAEEFSKLIQITEAKFFYGHQLFVQNMHYEMYNKLYEKLEPSNETRLKMFQLVDRKESTVNKFNWVSKWIAHGVFQEQLVASACMHGLFFTALDLIVHWLNTRSRKIMSHELLEIFRKMQFEQNLQRDFACLMVSNLRKKPTKAFAEKLINEATKLEFQFLSDLNLERIGIEGKDLLKIIDTRVTAIKVKLYSAITTTSALVAASIKDIGKQAEMNANGEPRTEQENAVAKEKIKSDHYKISFDEDF